MVVKNESKYYNTKTAKAGDVIEITSEAKMVAGKFGDKLTCNIDLNGSEKIWQMNNTCKNILIDCIGEETKKWIGTKLSVNIIQGRMPFISVEVIREV